MSRSRTDKVEIDKSRWICHIIWRFTQQNLLMNWIWRNKMRSEIIRRAQIPSSRNYMYDKTFTKTV